MPARRAAWTCKVLENRRARIGELIPRWTVYQLDSYGLPRAPAWRWAGSRGARPPNPRIHLQPRFGGVFFDLQAALSKRARVDLFRAQG